jgi:hypothetical protein
MSNLISVDFEASFKSTSIFGRPEEKKKKWCLDLGDGFWGGLPGNRDVTEAAFPMDMPFAQEDSTLRSEKPFFCK